MFNVKIVGVVPSNVREKDRLHYLPVGGEKWKRLDTCQLLPTQVGFRVEGEEGRSSTLVFDYVSEELLPSHDNLELVIEWITKLYSQRGETSIETLVDGVLKGSIQTSIPFPNCPPPYRCRWARGT